MEIIITIKIDGEEVKVSTETKSEEKQSDESDRIIKCELSNYARVFDDGCKGWAEDPEFNKMYLYYQQRYANELLRAKGYLLLNDIYDILGIPRSKAGCMVGWIYDKENPIGDNYVDFGLDCEKNFDFINGHGNVAYLDFNVDGMIIDYLN